MGFKASSQEPRDETQEGRENPEPELDPEVREERMAETQSECSDPDVFVRRECGHENEDESRHGGGNA